MGIGNKLEQCVVLLSVALIIGGSKACREDYCVACTATVGTITPEATATGTVTVTPTGTLTIVAATPTPTSTPSPTLTVTGTLTATPTGTLTATPTPTATEGEDDITLERLPINSLRRLSTASALKTAGAQKFGNWLGNIDRDDSDTDGDGYTNNLEKKLGSNPDDTDSVSSIAFQKFIRSTDLDSDGLSDSDEALLETSADKADSDGDGCSDGAEYLSGTNPLVKDSVVEDADGDCLSDEIEKQLGTNLQSRDSDQDKLSDPLEVGIGTDPNRPDTDGDGILDWKEAQQGSNPLVKDE